MTDRAEPKVSLSEAAYRRIYQDIVTCRLAPGTRLTEKQLVEETGFGLSPIRAALTRLDHDGLVLTVPRKGYRVSPLTPRSIENLFEVWSLVGPEVFRRGVAECSDEQQERILAAYEAMTTTLAGDDLDFATINQLASKFTTAVVIATGNPYLVQIHDRLAGDMARIWITVFENDPEVTPTLAGINYEALVNRDGDAVAEAAAATIAQFRERVHKVVANWPTVVDAEIGLASR